jgi:putative SOS response-associated peptidase YedK
MCGRYTLTYDIETIARAFNVAPTIETQPRYNIAPTQNIVTIMRNGTDQLALLRWGLIPSWAKEESIGSRMINARAETLNEKPSFKRLLDAKRCLVIADGFYEWQQEQKGPKTPMYISMQNHEPFAFAGLWDVWKNPQGEQVRTCTIITTQPNEVVASIHNRMPAILAREVREEWLDPAQHDTGFLQSLLAPYPADQMTARPVSRLVNDPKKEGAELLA